MQQISTLGRFASIVIFPHIQERYGQKKSLEEIKHFFIKTTRALTLALPFVIAFITFFVPVVVILFLPRFEAGLGAMRFLVLGYFFVAVNEMSCQILFTINQQARLIPLYLAGNGAAGLPVPTYRVRGHLFRLLVASNQ